MTAKEMLGKVDHTQLKAFATWEDIQKLCDEAIQYFWMSSQVAKAFSIIPPAYVCPLAISRESMTLTETKSISVP